MIVSGYEVKHETDRGNDAHSITYTVGRSRQVSEDLRMPRMASSKSNARRKVFHGVSDEENREEQNGGERPVCEQAPSRAATMSITPRKKGFLFGSVSHTAQKAHDSTTVSFPAPGASAGDHANDVASPMEGTWAEFTRECRRGGDLSAASPAARRRDRHRSESDQHKRQSPPNRARLAPDPKTGAPHGSSQSNTTENGSLVIGLREKINHLPEPQTASKRGRQEYRSGVRRSSRQRATDGVVGLGVFQEGATECDSDDEHAGERESKGGERQEPASKAEGSGKGSARASRQDQSHKAQSHPGGGLVVGGQATGDGAPKVAVKAEGSGKATRGLPLKDAPHKSQRCTSNEGVRPASMSWSQRDRATDGHPR